MSSIVLSELKAPVGGPRDRQILFETLAGPNCETLSGFFKASAESDLAKEFFETRW